MRYYDNESIKKYDLAIEKLCEKEGLVFISMFDLLENRDFADGLHPNSKGHKKMFDRIKQRLEEENIS